MLFMLLVKILLFSVLTFIPYAFCFVYESVGEVLKFTIAAAHKIDVVDESYVAHGPDTSGDECVAVME